MLATHRPSRPRLPFYSFLRSNCVLLPHQQEQDITTRKRKTQINLKTKNKHIDYSHVPPPPPS